MKIRFETTINDVIAFNRFHYSNSPAWRKQIWVQSLLVPVILAAVLAMVVVTIANGDAGFDPLVLLVMSVCFGTTWLAGSISWVFLIRWSLNRALVRNARKFLAEGSNRTMYGWREMEIVDGRLVLRTELLDMRMDLRAIEKIVSNDEYTFIYTASVSAYLIPMHVYPEEEHREFVAELREAWENRAVPMPTDDEPPNRRQINEGIVERDW
jgi:hypothetical protein